MSQSDNQTSSCTVCVLFIMAVIAVAIAVTLTALLYVWGYMGFMATSSLSISACPQPYFIYKYSDLTLLNQTIFVGTAVAAFAGIIIFLISMRLLVKNCSKDQKRSNEISKCSKMTLYLFTCLMIMGSTVQTGYYLSYVVEGSQCTLVADSTQMLVLLVLGGSALVCELIVLLITSCCLKQQIDSEQKYRWVDTKATQPNEVLPRRNESKPYFTQKKREYLRDPQDTKQQIFDSPSKKPLERIQQRNAVYVNKTYNSRPEPEMRFVPRQKQENPVFNLHPRLADDGVEQILNAKYNNRGPKNKDFQEDDERYLREARRNYMNEQNNRIPILRAEQPAYDRYDDRRRNRNDDYLPPRRDSRHRDKEDSYYDRNRSPNQYFRDIQPPKRRIQSPVRMRSRQQSGYYADRHY